MILIHDRSVGKFRRKTVPIARKCDDGGCKKRISFVIVFLLLYNAP